MEKQKDENFPIESENPIFKKEIGIKMINELNSSWKTSINLEKSKLKKNLKIEKVMNKILDI